MIECDPPPKGTELSPPAELVVCPFTVAVDTREQAPWRFHNIVLEQKLWFIHQGKRTMATGDYSIDGFEDRLCIERKSAADLVGSVGAGNARFRREHERMHAIAETSGFACVVIEGSLSTICEELDNEAGRRMTGDMIIGAAASWPQKYRVPWYFAGDRRYAELLAFRILLKWWRRKHERG